MLSAQTDYTQVTTFPSLRRSAVCEVDRNVFTSHYEIIFRVRMCVNNRMRAWSGGAGEEEETRSDGKVEWSWRFSPYCDSSFIVSLLQMGRMKGDASKSASGKESRSLGSVTQQIKGNKWRD